MLTGGDEAHAPRAGTGRIPPTVHETFEKSAE
jgi:hypothetical protein